MRFLILNLRSFESLGVSANFVLQLWDDLPCCKLELVLNRGESWTPETCQSRSQDNFDSKGGKEG